VLKKNLFYLTAAVHAGMGVRQLQMYMMGLNVQHPTKTTCKKRLCTMTTKEKRLENPHDSVITCTVVRA
jgi:purine nucleoside permease